MKKMVLFAVLLSLSCSGYAHAADSTAFDPTRVRIQAQNSIPVGTIIAWHSTGNPADIRNPDGTYNWLECNGQSVSRTAYPELFAAVGSRTPDLRGQFLRGLDAGHSVGEKVQDTFKSHAHGQPEHTHTFSGQLASTAISGTAAGQKYYDMKSGLLSSNVSGSADFIKHVDKIFPGASTGSMGTWIAGAKTSSSKPSSSTVIGQTSSGTTGAGGSHFHEAYFYYDGQNISGSTSGGGSHSHSIPKMNITSNNWSHWGIDGGADYAEASAVTGSLTNGTVTGTIGSGGGDETYAAGDAETAPKHTYVRYFIRARP